MAESRPPRRRAARGPQNQSRGAGEAAPPSAAATAPRPGPMYEPGDSGFTGHAEAHGPAQTDIDDEREQRARDFAQAVAAGAVQDVHANVGMDLSVAVQDLRDEMDLSEDEAAQLLRDIERVRGLKRTLNGTTQKLALPRRRGYYTHWFNDEAGRVQDALDNGWTHRLDREKRSLRRAVGTGRDKGVLYAFAMDIPEMFRAEDMAARHSVASARMDALKAQPFMARKGQATVQDKGKFYNPTETGDPLTIEKSNPTTPL